MSIIDERKRLLADRNFEVPNSPCNSVMPLMNGYMDCLSSVAENRADLALIAVGGYGRRDLSPLSDLDVLLLHNNAPDIEEVAEALWYPIWDQGENLDIQSGH